MVSKFRLDTPKNAATNEAISRTLEIANHYAGELSIEVLPLNKIELDPDNHRELFLTLEDAVNGIEKTDPAYERKKQDWKSLESLAQTIKEDQLINPIYVYRFGNKCRVIAGERRTLASAIAGKKEIIARIAGQRPVGTKLKVLQWIENNERSDLSLSERIATIEAIFHEYKKEHKGEEEKITAKLLSDLTGMSLTQARRYILIVQSQPEIRQAISTGQLENVKLIELISSVKSADHQSELLQAVIMGASFEEVLKLKRDLENTVKRKRKVKSKENTTINPGPVSLNVAKLLVGAVSTTHLLEDHLTKQLREIDDKLQWSDSQSIERGFKMILTLLEGTLVK